MEKKVSVVLAEIEMRKKTVQIFKPDQITQIKGCQLTLTAWEIYCRRTKCILLRIKSNNAKKCGKDKQRKNKYIDPFDTSGPYKASLDYKQNFY